MFKRCSILALALIMILSFAPCALAAEGDTALFERSDSGYSEIYPESAVAVGDTLYLCTWEDLYVYKLGDAEPVKLLPLREKEELSEKPVAAATPAPVESIDGVAAEEEAPAEYDWRDRLTLPFAYRGKLHMVYESTGEIRVLEGDQFVETGMKIEVPEDTEGYSLSNYITTIFEIEDKLYALARVDFENWDTAMELWVIDPETGGHEVIKTELSLKGVCAYEPGKLLGWTRAEWSDASGEVKEEVYYPKMFVLDAATGKTLEEPVVAAEVAWNSLCGPIYDANSGMIYYASQNKLLRKSSLSAEAEVMSYFNRELYELNSSGSILAGTHLVFPTSDGVFIRNIEQGAMAGKPVKIANYYMSNTASSFMSENPDIPLEFVELNGFYSASPDEVARLIGSGEDSVDIYLVWRSSNVRQLIEKGYALDLSGSEVIMRAVDRMYGAIREEISADGKPMAFPSGVSPSLWVYNKEKFDELGLEFPETYSDYLDLYERWENELKAENPSIAFTMELDADRSESDIKKGMFYSVLYQYVQECEGKDGPIKFNTPEFLETMRKVEALPGGFESEDNGWGYSYGEDFVQLLSTYFGFEYYSSEGGANTPIYVPRISADTEPGVGVSLSVFIINPNSANVDNAIKFLEYMTDHSEYSTMLTMYPDYNELIKDEWAVQDLENAQKELAEAKAVEVTDENRRDVEERIKAAERWVEQVESQQWRAKQETIDSYRAIIEDSRLFVTSGNSLFDSDTASKEINDLIERYMKGQLNLEQMVRELDQKMQMIYLEQQ